MPGNTVRAAQRIRELQVPDSLRAEHLALHRELARFLQKPGAVGRIAHSLSQVLHRHFLEEEQVVFPPLSLLPHLSEGRLPRGVDEGIAACDRLRELLPALLREHREIVADINRLVVAAGGSMTAEAAFARHVADHIRLEEEILYPMAVVLGTRLRALRADSWEP